MNQIVIFATLLTILMSSCQNERETIFEREKQGVFTDLYNDSQIKSELFEISPLKDTTLITKNGTTIRIYANSFIINDSDSVSSFINIEVKEAYKPIDFVLGNLTTTTDNQVLTSGGMIYLNAQSGGQQLKLKEGSEIGFIVPAEVIDESMMIYRGERDSSDMINWQSPEPILNSQLRTLDRTFVTISLKHSGEWKENDGKLNDWLWVSNRKVGDKIIVDEEEVEILEITRDSVSLRESENGIFIQDVFTQKGRNGFVDDYNTAYIFSIKKLGWTNIDKFFDDPKSEEVEMLVTVNNKSEFEYIFTSLLLPEHNVYIPGYQKKDGTYGFSLNDDQKLVLPVGSKAILLATAYKDDKPYYELKPVKIEHHMNLSLKLKETSPEGLKKALEDNI